MAVKRDRISEFVDGWRAEHPGEPFIPQLEKASSYFATELRSMSLREIRSWLAECDSKKAALEKEFSHLKKHYSPLSDEREDWDYNFCERAIPHIRLEIERRARGGNAPNRADTSGTGSNPDSEAQREFKHSPDNRVAGQPQPAKRKREREPDYRTSRERMALEDSLRSELGTIKSRAEHSATLDQLKKEFPAFELWKILSLKEQQELLSEEFKPIQYARTLVARKYGVGSETIKKDRQKLRRANK